MNNDFDLTSLAEIGANVARVFKEEHPENMEFPSEQLPEEFIDGFLSEAARP